jgi:integrase
MSRKKAKGNGTGTVYPRKNKDGKVVSYLGAYVGPDGKRRYVSGKTKGECERNLRAAMADADKGLVFDASNAKLSEYLDRWLNDSVRGSVRPVTHESYSRLVRVHIAPALGGVKL